MGSGGAESNFENLLKSLEIKKIKKFQKEMKIMQKKIKIKEKKKKEKY